MDEEYLRKMQDGLEVNDEIFPFIVQSCPRMLPGEKEIDYYELFILMAIDILPDDFVEWITLIDIVLILWDIHRYRRWKYAILSIGRKAALETVLAKVDPGNLIAGAEKTIRAQAVLDAEAWQDDPARRAVLDAKLAKNGFDAETINATAFLESLPSLTEIERFLLSARRQAMLMLREIGLRREFARRVRKAFVERSEAKIEPDEVQKVIGSA
jgi:hypothetical protein